MNTKRRRKGISGAEHGNTQRDKNKIDVGAKP